ncbi:MAG: helix-turn-helix transcriptional regulator [Trebonia sp.]|jgi:transcriptional regulator with XRE-family HTH domain
MSPARAKDTLGAFLRSRREALHPEDIGLRRGPHRRAGGLRREEVAELSGISTDYIGRLERGSGPWPSSEVLAALARGLRLTTAERNHLFALCGRTAPLSPAAEHIDVGIQRILDRLEDTPAQVMGQAGTTLRQTPPAVALLGDETAYRGLSRSAAYRWFTDPVGRDLYPARDHDANSRIQASLLRESLARYGDGSFTAQVVAALLDRSDEFPGVWELQEVGLGFPPEKHLDHPEVGGLELYCQALFDGGSGQFLLVFTAAPGSESHGRLALLSVIGRQLLEGS